MSAGLHPTEPVAEGHTYRLNPDQYARAVVAGIIPGQVELRDGFLRLMPAEGEPSAGEDYRLSLDQYRAMAREDILTTDDRVELLEGWLIVKMTKKPPHEIAKGLTQDFLIASKPPGWFVAIEGPAGTLDSEPEPDLMVVRGARRDYQEGAPGPHQIALVVEVAYSSLAEDRSRKKRIYARSGFPLYWLINLIDHRIEVYTEPTGPIEEPDYRLHRDYGPADEIPLVIEGREVGRIAVRDLLP
jgi:Uma2 family endonuclease